MTREPRDLVHALTVGANLLVMALNLWLWKAGVNTAVAVAISAFTAVGVIALRRIGDAHVAHLRGRLRKVEVDLALSEEVLAKVRAGEARVDLERPIRTM